MSVMKAFLMEFEMESVTTRRVLERLPAGQFGWKPHEKSMTLGQLASHTTQIPGWTAVTLAQNELLLDPANYKPWLATNPEELLARFDENVISAKEALQKTPDRVLAEIWILKSPEKTLFQAPKSAVLRGFVLNHLIHHRGQLSVYLRMLDIPVPSIYGPSADEPGFN